MDARYRFAADKAMNAILWMTAQPEPLDLHAALKTCYFADKSHLNAFQQPIFGANYRAMAYGPVPLEIYEMIKGEALWLAELGRPRMPWRLDGYRIVREGNEFPDTEVFADSEWQHLEAAYARSSRMSFGSRTAATHGPDWQAAKGGRMRYEDMLEPGAHRDEAVAFMRETSRHARL
jgi:hypothetical protein